VSKLAGQKYRGCGNLFSWTWSKNMALEINCHILIIQRLFDKSVET
jgi:hypothetical protein